MQDLHCTSSTCWDDSIWVVLIDKRIEIVHYAFRLPKFFCDNNSLLTQHRDAGRLSFIAGVAKYFMCWMDISVLQCNLILLHDL